MIESFGINVRTNGPNKYKSISNVRWCDIPGFAILTGKNGSGKTQLLELMAYHFSGSRPPGANYNTTVTASGASYAPSDVSYVPSVGRFSDGPAISLTSIAQRRQNLINSAAQAIQGAQYYEPVSAAVSRRAAKVFGGLNPQALTVEQIDKLLEKGADWIIDDIDMTASIGFVFFDYRIKSLEALERGTPGLDLDGNPLGPAPWDVVNDALQTAAFPYEVVSPKEVSITRDYKFKLKDRSTSSIIEVTELSSGEKVIIQLVLWLYSSNTTRSFPKLLLLDEPDAHLHPSMTMQFMDVIDEVLVKKHGVRVIMSSHSPSTIALAPENAIFQMERGNTEITRVSNRQDIISVLTSGLVTVSKATKFCFVEDEDDVYFYECIRDILTDYGPSKDPRSLATSPTIVFIKASIGERAEKISGGSSVVCKWIDKLDAEPLNKSFVGLIDRDAGNINCGRIFTIGRYSIENYILDPINIFALLVEERAAPQIANLEISSGNEHLIRLFDEAVLQSIADEICKRMELGAPQLITDRKCPVIYTNGRTVTFPAWILEYRGHDLLPIAQRLFGGAKLINYPRLLKSMLRCRMVPAELPKILSAIQLY